MRKRARYAAQILALVLIADVLVLCTVSHAGARIPTLSVLEYNPPTSVASGASASVSVGSGLRIRNTVVAAVHALTARLIDQRTRAALPQASDLGVNHAASGDAPDPVPHPAVLGAERPGTSNPPETTRSVSGDAVAFGAPEAGGHGGIGTSTLSGAGSGAASSAVLSGLSELAEHAAFTVDRHTTRTDTIHTSVQPLDRPG
jgi:hypothetical protein